MRFADEEGCSVSVESRWLFEQRQRESHAGCQTDDLEVCSVGTQSVWRSEACVQTANAQDEEAKDREEKEDDGDGDGDGDGGDADDDKEEDSAALQAFVRDAGAAMLEALAENDVSAAFSEWGVAGRQLDRAPDGSNFKAWEVHRTLRRPRGNVEAEDDLCCTCVSWSATGSQAVASYGRFDNVGWCSHRGSVCVWDAFSTSTSTSSSSSADSAEQPAMRVTVPCGVMSVAAHPSRPSVIVAGTYNGEVMLLDTNKEDAVVACSQIEDFCHKEPVMRVAWVRDTRAGARPEEDFLVASTSGDGKVLFWDAATDLAAPLQGLALSSKSRPGRVLGGTALGFCSSGKAFIVGAEGGAVSRCNMSSATLHQKNSKISKISKSEVGKVGPGIRFAFQPHVGPVHAVACSPFHRNAFLSCGDDGRLHLSSLLHKEPALVLHPSPCAADRLFDAAWSPHRPAVFATASSAGQVLFFDLAQDASEPVAVVPVRDAGPVHSLAFNRHTRGMVCAGDGQGDVHILKLSWTLSNRQPVDKSALDQIMFTNL